MFTLVTAKKLINSRYDHLINMQKLAEVDVYHDGESFKVVITNPNGDELILEGDELEEILEQLATEMSDRFGKI
jgi:hypothetical protein